MTFLTEAEARKKACPEMIRAGREWAANGGIPKRCRCIASECMAWRAETEREWATTAMKPVGDGYAMRVVRPDGEGWREANGPGIDTGAYRWVRELPTGRGFCGLARRPE